MGKTSTDARRHIREWSAFFRDLNEAGGEVVEEFIRRHQSRKYLRQSLKRLIARGFLKEKEKKFFITKAGSKFFRGSKEANVLLRKDGKWYLLSFDIPVKFNSKRAALRRVLAKYRFFPLQKSVWVGPDQLATDVWEFIVEQGLEKFCAPMIVDILEGDDALKEHFGL